MDDGNMFKTLKVSRYVFLNPAPCLPCVLFSIPIMNGLCAALGLRMLNGLPVAEVEKK